MARGIAPRLNQWENDLLAVHVPFKHAENQPLGILQLGVRPIRFYEIAFPEPALNYVLQKIQPTQGANPGFKKYFAALRMLMKLEKLPEVPQVDNVNNFLYKEFVDCTGIGIKRDIFLNPSKGIEQI